MSRSFVKRAAAIGGVLVLAAIAAVGTAAPASAAPGNIDPAIARTLTIHKLGLTSTSVQTPATGREIPGGVAGTTPLAGATFTVTRIPSVDLTTAAGWTTAGQLTPATAAPLATGPAVSQTTAGTAGTAVFTGLDIGLYLVEETGLPPGVTNAAAPVLVTLPFPSGPGGTPANDWIYDVHLYPKNSTSTLTKERVVPAAGSTEARNPDLVRWALRSSIPVLAPGQSMSQFVLTDTITPALTFVDTPPADVPTSGVVVTNASGEEQTFTSPADYSIATTATTSTLTFTPAGRGRLATLGGGEVVFNVLTRAASVPANGLITNTATAQINGVTETATGTTAIGQLTLFAYATPSVPGGPQTPLAGAVFQVFLTQADADAGNAPISLNGVTQWTSGANGQVLISQLVPGTYYVKEISPPVGFQIPVPATQAAQVIAGPTSTTAPVQNYLTVPHSQVPAFALPLTGGDGAIWFGVGGGAILLIAVGAAIVVARRRAVQTRPGV